jgi:hypothetical protein
VSVRQFVRDYSLSLALAVLFIVSWLFQTVSGWYEYVSEQQVHGDPATAFGPDGYFWMWAESTFENWQSEFLQLFTFVVLTTFLIHRGSHESRDSDEELKQMLERIEKAVGAKQAGRKS